MARSVSRHLKRIARYILIILLLSGLAYGNEERGVEIYLKYLRISGLRAQIKNVPKVLLGSLPADAFGDSRGKTKVERLFYGKIDSDEWVSSVATDLQKTVDTTIVEELANFYESRLGRKLGRLQEGSLNLWTLRGIREGHSRVSALDEDRLLLLKGLVQKGEFERFNLEAVETVVRGLLEGYAGQASGMGFARRDSERTIDYSLKITRGRTNDICIVSLANTFESLSDKELADVVSFLESDASLCMAKAYQKALKHILFEASCTLGQSMREAAAPSANGSSSSR